MVRAHTTTMSNSMTQRLRTLQNSIEQLPNPSTVWTWSDGLDLVGPSELEKLESVDAIERVDSKWWRVPPRVAEYVKRVYGAEPNGNIGQDTLPVGRLVPAIDRVDTRIDSRRGRQVTLDGGPVTIHTQDGDDGGSERVHPSERPGQLDVFTAIARCKCKISC